MHIIGASPLSDSDAWDRLVSLYTPLVRDWCRRTGVPPAEIQDVTQDTFLAVSLSLATFTPTRAGSFRKWVRGIVRHKALDNLRRRHGEAVAAGGTVAQEMIQSLPEADAADVEAEEVGGLCRRALDLIQGQFEDRTWRAFWRSAVDSQPTDVIAAELDMSPVSIRVAKSRVLARLREELGVLIQ